MRTLLRLFGVAALAVLISSVATAQSPAAASQKTIAERLGYPPDARLLIIHADDFGMMHSVDTAIEEAFEKHWITSASILVPCPWFPEVAKWAKEHPDADLGIHLALNADWTGYRWPAVSPQAPGSSLLDADGYLPLTTEYVVKHAKMSDVATETHAQVDKAKAAGIRLTHLDTHMGTIVSSGDLLGVYVQTGRDYKLPVMLIKTENPPPALLQANTVVLDGLYEMLPGVPQAEWLNYYKKMLAPLKPGGIYQLVVHLAHNDEEMQGATWDHPDWGAQWRQNDLDLVSNPEFQKFLKEQKFILVNWGDLAKAK
jgi:chitin disaccharide deacetylase